MILEHFWKIVFAIIFGVAGYFWWEHYSGEVETTRSAERVATLLDDRAYPDRTGTARFEKAVFQALALVWRAEQNGIDVSELLRQMGEIRGGDNDRLAKAFVAGVKRNLERCTELGVFEDSGDNLTRMEIGRAPVATRGAYAGFPVAVSPLVPPLLAPQARHHIANVDLVPEPVRTLTPLLRINSDVHDVSARLKSAGIIDTATAAKVARQYQLGD